MPPEHRLEFVVEIDGVKYYNDSKATNVDSVKMALTAFNEPVVLILGGRDKAADFRVLSSAIQQKVRHLIITGEAGEKIHNQLKNVTATTVIKDFRKAVEQAGQLAQKGDVVLLSPACASFDAFRNFEERGKFFKKIVKGMQ
jgi:UDP-N-acetylmuramoylalanine--D-glutamate ligase